MRQEFFIKPPHDRRPKLITMLNGELINLTGKDVTEKRPATKSEPSVDIKVRGATQEDLRRLYEDPALGDFSRLIGVKETVKPDAK